ncbi:hypothetical protein PSTT_17041, partial [Puccinia striiformis]
MSYHFPLSLSHSDKRQHQVQQQTNNCRVQSQASQEKTHPIHPKCLVIDTLTGDAQQPHRQFSATQKSRQPDNPRHPIPIPTSCANCGTLNTPLWRRNHLGATLCNACALFQKMKGRPRPMSLKTNVIKSRNRIKAIDRIPHQKNKDGMLSTSGSSNSSSSCSTPIHQHQQQPNLTQQAISRLGDNHSYHHSSPSSPSDPQFVKSSQTYLLHSDYNNRKQGSPHSSKDSFRPPLSNSSAINLPTQISFSHSQPSPQPSPLNRTEAYHSRKSSPGGTDPLNQVLLLSDISDQPKRRKPSLYAPHRATRPRTLFLLGGALLSSSVTTTSRPIRPPSMSHGFIPPTLTVRPLTAATLSSLIITSIPLRMIAPTVLPTIHPHPSVDRIPSRGDEGEKGQASVGTDDPGRSNQSPLTLPPLSQLTRHLKATKLQGGLRTAELGPPKSFEASAREARLHTPTSPQNNLLAIPTGRR